jgi:hypothetical protein
MLLVEVAAEVDVDVDVVVGRRETTRKWQRK